jgi:hypothetical protein
METDSIKKGEGLRKTEELGFTQGLGGKDNRISEIKREAE